METNETRKGKYSKIILKKIYKTEETKIKSKKKEKIKHIIMKKNPT
jgi:hypothetical protein